MRIESSVTSVSWIPSETVPGPGKAIFSTGVTHYDDPPPEIITDLAGLFAAERFRFANHLAAWIDVQDGRVTGAGYSGRGYISCTRVGPHQEVTFHPAEFPELRTDPEITGSGARFTQTTGGQAGVPAPRPVSGKPFVQWRAPTVWTTLTLFIGADGTARGEMTGASPFPRHWIYDDQGQLTAKSGQADLYQWLLTSHGQHTPWGHEDSRPLVTVAESALERQLSAAIMHGGARPAIRRLHHGAVLSRQGEPGDGIYLLLDGVLSVCVDGAQVAELGPGAVAGERALLEHGRRTATLTAVTDCVVAVAGRDQVDRDSLASLAGQHHRER